MQKLHMLPHFKHLQKGKLGAGVRGAYTVRLEQEMGSLVDIVVKLCSIHVSIYEREFVWTCLDVFGRVGGYATSSSCIDRCHY